jgi:hypothetical protein
MGSCLLREKVTGGKPKRFPVELQVKMRAREQSRDPVMFQEESAAVNCPSDRRRKRSQQRLSLPSTVVVCFYVALY